MPDSPEEAQPPEAQTGPEPSLVRSILEGAHEAFISMDAGGFITDWNRAAEQTFGWSRNEAVGSVLADTIVPQRYRQAHWVGLQRYLETGEGPVLAKRLELSAMHREGHEFPIELTISVAQAGGRPSFHAFLHDISARKLSERLLHAQHAVTHALATATTAQEAIHAVMAALGESMEWDRGGYWAADAGEGVLQRVASWRAPSIAEDEFELQSDELHLAPGVGLPGAAWESREPVWAEDFRTETSFPRVEAAARAGLRAAVCVPVLHAAEVAGVIEFLGRQPRAPDQSMSQVLAAVGAQIGQLVSALEERGKLLTKLETLALTDELTGLPNRRAWEDGLARELARAGRERQPVCLAVLDLDGFKRFNDERGHQAGDALLAETAATWRACLRAGDLLARYGGEEFTALFPAFTIEAAVAVVDRLRAATPASQTCSAGVAAWNGSETADELFGRADAALYAAKQAGRARTVAAPSYASHGTP